MVIRTTLCHAFTTKSPRFYHHKTRKNRETPNEIALLLQIIFLGLADYFFLFH